MEIRNLILLILTCVALVFTIAYLLLGKIKNSKANAEKIATIEVTIEVKDVTLLNKVVRELGKIDSVYEVKRTK